MSISQCSAFLATLRPILRKYSALMTIYTEAERNPVVVDKAFFTYMMKNRDCLDNFELWHGAIELPHAVRFDMSTPFKKAKNNAVILQAMMAEWLNLAKLLLTDENMHAMRLEHEADEQKRSVVAFFAEKIGCAELMQRDADVATFFEVILASLTNEDLEAMSQLEPVLKEAAEAAEAQNMGEAMGAIMNSPVLTILMQKFVGHITSVKSAELMRGAKKIIRQLQVSSDAPAHINHMLSEVANLIPEN